MPRWRPLPGGALCRCGPTAYVLSSPVAIKIGGGDASARFRIGRSERLGFALRLAHPWEPPPSPWSTDQVRAWMHGTVRGWQWWSELHQRYQGPSAGLVHRSGRGAPALT